MGSGHPRGNMVMHLGDACPETGTAMAKTRLSISLAFSLSAAMVSMVGNGY